MLDPRLQTALILQEILEQHIFATEAKNRLHYTSELDNAFSNMLLQTTLRHLVYIQKFLNPLLETSYPPP